MGDYDFALKAFGVCLVGGGLVTGILVTAGVAGVAAVGGWDYALGLLGLGVVFGAGLTLGLTAR
jgi:hypothetical protein